MERNQNGKQTDQPDSQSSTKPMSLAGARVSICLAHLLWSVVLPAIYTRLDPYET